MSAPPGEDRIRRVAILGGGSWGTVLALIAAERASQVRVWCRDPEICAGVARTGRNGRYLPEVALPDRVRFTPDAAEALESSELVIVALPTAAVRLAVRAVAAAIPADAVLVSACKGIETETHCRVSEILAGEMAAAGGRAIAAVSGPNLAREMAAGKPTGAVVASTDPAAAALVQRALSGPFYRLYTSSDVVGVEMGGALKNIIAIGAGIVSGLGLGENSMGALLTRGLAEMARLGVRQGARPLTFNGLSGVGDLIATCASPLSRNRTVGAAIARGTALDRALAELGMVAEGVPTTRAVHAQASLLAVDMPITREIHSVLFEGKDARAAVVDLMTRDLKSEEEFS